MVARLFEGRGDCVAYLKNLLMSKHSQPSSPDIEWAVRLNHITRMTLVRALSANSAKENASSGALRNSFMSAGPLATAVVPKGNNRILNHPFGYWEQRVELIRSYRAYNDFWREQKNLLWRVSGRFQAWRRGGGRGELVVLNSIGIPDINTYKSS